MFPRLVLGIPICFPVHHVNIGCGKNGGRQLPFEIDLAKNKRGWGGALLFSDEYVRSFKMTALTDWSALSVLS